MRILITGASGFIGHEIYTALSNGGTDEVLGIDKNESEGIMAYDVSDPKAFLQLLNNYKPDLIIHTAAIKDLMQCEKDKNGAFITNVISTETIVNYVKGNNINAKVIYISSDVVFDGTVGKYAPSDTPNPINWYGKTKLFSEMILKNIPNYCILRTALVIGELNEQYMSLLKSELNNSVLKNQTLLPHFIFNKLVADMVVALPSDIISNPTPVNLLTEIVLRLSKNFISGVFHSAGATPISRYDFALTIAKKYHFNTDLVKVDNSNTLGIRPKNISLDVTESLRLLGVNPADWELNNYINKIKFIEI